MKQGVGERRPGISRNPRRRKVSGASEGLGRSPRWPNRLESEGVQAHQEAFHGPVASSERLLGLIRTKGKPEEKKFKKLLQERWRRRRRGRSRETSSRKTVLLGTVPVRKAPSAGGRGEGASGEVGGEAEAEGEEREREGLVEGRRQIGRAHV